jgi:hypothetical protein
MLNMFHITRLNFWHPTVVSIAIVTMSEKLFLETFQNINSSTGTTLRMYREPVLVQKRHRHNTHDTDCAGHGVDMHDQGVLSPGIQSLDMQTTVQYLTSTHNNFF